MGLVLKHVEKTKAGSWQYRRRVPKDVAGVISKREFKRKLGESEKEALAAYPRYHAEVEREIAEAARGRVRSASLTGGTQTKRDAHAAALRWRAELVSLGASEEELGIVADNLADEFPQDEDGPLGVPMLERYKINVLRNNTRKPPKAPKPTLRDALKLYLKEHLNADSPETDSRVVGLARRVIEAAIAAIGKDPALSSISREDARSVRAHMLDRVKKTGKGVGGKVSAATVSRELSIIAAVVNFAKKEQLIGADVHNPFTQLPVEKIAKGLGRKESENRDPLPLVVLAKARARVIANASPELALIWRLIEGTGCRIAEITGLRRDDVLANGELPHLRIEPNASRPLKTEASRRQVPLVEDALVAARETLEVAPEGQEMLFPSYGRKRGGDAASAALMKHLRKVSEDEKHVIHSMRHNMTDRLLLSEAAELDRKLILGHTVGDVGDRVYGSAGAKLRAITRTMKRAFGIKDVA